MKNIIYFLVPSEKAKTGRAGTDKNLRYAKNRLIK